MSSEERSQGKEMKTRATKTLLGNDQTFFYKKVSAILHTNGQGLWSSQKRAVAIKALEVNFYDDDEYGELRVFFKANSWNTKKHGLIYTDKLFLKELKAYLKSIGLPASNVDYSEQGMQGDEFVSLDVGKKFIKEFTDGNRR